MTCTPPCHVLNSWNEMFIMKVYFLREVSGSGGGSDSGRGHGGRGRGRDLGRDRDRSKGRGRSGLVRKRKEVDPERTEEESTQGTGEVKR